MDLKTKVANALKRRFQADHIDLSDDNGVFGIIVSPDFRQKAALDRQLMIQNALRAPEGGISATERSRVFAIAGLTPAEYAEFEPPVKSKRTSRGQRSPGKRQTPT